MWKKKSQSKQRGIERADIQTVFKQYGQPTDWAPPTMEVDPRFRAVSSCLPTIP